MANAKQSIVRRMKMRERAEKQRSVLFSAIDDALLWHRLRNHGYTTIPRTMPIVMEGIDLLTKSQPAGHTYFSLWCRAPDDPLLVIESPIIFAGEAGFKGERAVDTWRRRMRALKELGFIDARPGVAGDFHYVLLLNPHMVLERLHQEKKLPESVYAKFHERMLDIGTYSEIEQAREAIENEKQGAEANQDAVPVPEAIKTIEL
jgi:hypothetical protein